MVEREKEYMMEREEEYVVERKKGYVVGTIVALAPWHHGIQDGDSVSDGMEVVATCFVAAVVLVIVVVFHLSFTERKTIPTLQIRVTLNNKMYLLSRNST